MPSRRPSKKDSPKKLAARMKRRWRVVLLRAKGEILGEVEASDVASAKAAAAVQFELDEIQHNRIMVQESRLRGT
jgi:tRNA threonylcarbamoyladenosine modification (KEOPS) complex  Pcc1 subunit